MRDTAPSNLGTRLTLTFCAACHVSTQLPGCYPFQAWIDRWNQTFQSRTRDMAPEDLANSLMAMAKLGIGNMGGDDKRRGGGGGGGGRLDDMGLEDGLDMDMDMPFPEPDFDDFDDLAGDDYGADFGDQDFDAPAAGPAGMCPLLRCCLCHVVRKAMSTLCYSWQQFCKALARLKQLACTCQAGWAQLAMRVHLDPACLHVSRCCCWRMMLTRTTCTTWVTNGVSARPKRAHLRLAGCVGPVRHVSYLLFMHFVCVQVLLLAAASTWTSCTTWRTSRASARPKLAASRHTAATSWRRPLTLTSHQDQARLG